MNIRTAIACASAAILVAGCGGKGEGATGAGRAEAARKTGAAPSKDEFSEVSAFEKSVMAVFAKAAKVADDGGINFCGFYLGMTEADAQLLASHYGLENGELTGGVAPFSKTVFSLKFSLKGVRRITKGGNSFDELAQAVANRIGTMKPGRNGSYGAAGYEYKNIDGQTAFISEDGGLVLEDGNLSRKLMKEFLIANLDDDMVPIPGRDYSICKYEVTQALWDAVMGGNPSEFKGEDRPVENVSWNDCQKFLEKLNALPEVKAAGVRYRLPTADEWEYACRTGSTGDYCKLADGTEITRDTLGEVAWYGDNSKIDGKGQTHPVGQKKPNAFGLYDMHGNVEEWTSTADGSERVNCGGSWSDYANNCGAGSRFSYFPAYRDSYLGFRLAR